MDVAGVMSELNTIHDDRAALVFLQAVEGADEGRLARAGGAEDHDHLALLDLHRDALQGVEAAEPFVHVSTDDDGFTHRALLA